MNLSDKKKVSNENVLAFFAFRVKTSCNKRVDCNLLIYCANKQQLFFQHPFTKSFFLRNELTLFMPGRV